MRSFLRKKSWEMLIASFAILTIVISALNGYYFWTLEKLTAESLTMETSTKTIKRGLLNEIIDNLNKKEVNFEKNLLTKPNVADPST